MYDHVLFSEQTWLLINELRINQSALCMQSVSLIPKDDVGKNVFTVLVYFLFLRIARFSDIDTASLETCIISAVL